MKQASSYIVILVLGLACSRTREQAEISSIRTSTALPFPNASGGDEDMANHIPGYGGAFRENGGLTIYLKNLRDSLPALAEANLALRSRPDIRTIKFIKGKYTYAQLRAFLNELGKGDGLNGVVGDGVDSGRNRVRLVFQTNDEIGRVTKTIRKLGLPLDAFIFEIGKPATVA